MRGRNTFLGVAAVLVFAAVVLLTSPWAWAQKAAKPPQPPAPPADPAIAYKANIYRGASMAKTVGRLMVMNADGSNQRVVISETGFEYGAPDWSPDGTQLVFSRYNIPARDTGIYVVNVDGTGLREVFNCGEGGLEGPVTWSPMPLADGHHKLAFCYHVRRPDGTYEIDNDVHLVNLDGSGLVRLTDTPDVWESPISWSPMADMITFPACCDPETGAGGFAVCQILYIEGVFSLLNLQNNFTFPWGIWANTNNRLATGKDNDIWIVNLLDPSNTAEPVTSTPSLGEHDQSWSPDDSKILFVQSPSGQLSIIQTDGTGLTTICPGVDFSWRAPRWRRNL